MSAESTPGSERFQTAVTILIALVSTAIALVASQAALVIGNTTEALHNGVLAKINQERVDGGSWVQIARNQQAYDDYRFRLSLSDLTRTYAADAEAAQNLPYATRLRLEAVGLREESTLAYNAMDSYYLMTDADGKQTGFDAARFVTDERQSAETGQHLDLRYEDDFEEASNLRGTAAVLSSSIIVLFVSVMFLTWAQITKSGLRWLWLLLGTGIALLVAAAFALSSLGVLDWLNALVFG